LSHYSVELVSDEHGPVVILIGELDADAATALQECLHVLRRRRLAVDLERVTFLDATVVDILVAAQRQHALDGAPVQVRGVRPEQMPLLELAGLDEMPSTEPAR
jgi:anti-anti-sigma factor